MASEREQRYFEIEGENFVDKGSILASKERNHPDNARSTFASEIIKTYGPVIKKRSSFRGVDLERLYQQMRRQTYDFFKGFFKSDTERRFFLYLTAKHEIFFYSPTEIGILPIQQIDSDHWDLLALLSDETQYGALKMGKWVGERALGTIIFINEEKLLKESQVGEGGTSLRQGTKETVTHELVHAVEWAIMAAHDSKVKPLDDGFVEGYALMIVEGKSLDWDSP